MMVNTKKSEGRLRCELWPDAFMSMSTSLLRTRDIPFSSMMTVEGTFVTTIYW